MLARPSLQHVINHQAKPPLDGKIQRSKKHCPAGTLLDFGGWPAQHQDRWPYLHSSGPLSGPPTRNSKFYEQYQKDPSLKLKYVLTLEEVPGFSLIRVHPGVKIGDTRGCPLLGLATDMDADSNFTVARSREALKRIHRYLDAFFDEKGMDFRVPVWWEVVRVPLIGFDKI